MSKGSHRRGAKGARGVPSSRSVSSAIHHEEHAAAGHRHGRLTQLFREEIEGLLRDEVRDPRLSGVRVTSVELSVDYRNVRVRFVAPEASDQRAHTEVQRALERAAGFLRARLVESAGIKHAPTLRFVPDPDARPGGVSEQTPEQDSGEDPEAPWRA